MKLTPEQIRKVADRLIVIDESDGNIKEMLETLACLVEKRILATKDCAFDCIFCYFDYDAEVHKCLASDLENDRWMEGKHGTNYSRQCDKGFCIPDWCPLRKAPIMVMMEAPDEKI